jgi:hypothetical protein
MYLFDKQGRLPAEGFFVASRRKVPQGGYKVFQVLPSKKRTGYVICGTADLLRLMENGFKVIYANDDGF